MVLISIDGNIVAERGFPCKWRKMISRDIVSCNIMAFIDEMEVHMRAGRGGNGVVRWLHEKFKEFGGPAGGDGGRGGDIYVRGKRDTMLLARYKNIREFNAENGQPGGNSSKHGANGESLYIDLPVGSVIKNKTTGDEFRIDEEGQEILILKGGNGGMGNERFKGPTNQTPEEWTPGKNGEEADFYIEVELIADVGLVGLPNAGKSSLLNALTKANVKVGAYEFTTLEPNLGALYGKIIADIPGLIEGAADGKGLGHKFLRHIRRTKALFHCISLEHGTAKDVLDVYKTIRSELESYDEGMADKKEVIVITKTDVVSPQDLDGLLSDIRDLFESSGVLKNKDGSTKDMLTVSAYDIDSLKRLSEYITQHI
ncbi:MAG: GTPase ObgE [Candidatus Taylorbacteria bacterium]|nr:GTPase ObgE [Candidatus Taylorbacteria bacterium]